MANITFPRNVTCLQLSEIEIHCHGLRYDEFEAPLSISDKMFWIYLGLYVVLVLFAGKLTHTLTPKSLYTAGSTICIQHI